MRGFLGDCAGQLDKLSVTIGDILGTQISQMSDPQISEDCHRLSALARFMPPVCQPMEEIGGCRLRRA